MNCGIFDVRLDGTVLAAGRGVEPRNVALFVFFPFRLECHPASEPAALLASMNGLGRRPFPAAISSMLRPEATDRSISETGARFSRSWPSRCLMRSQLLRPLFSLS